ncbi:MAG: SDR family oxidoreductase [Planctomycetota bacterium]|nr:SDR family oxidoreductase [Planctomycetota bacterium]
MERSDKTLVVGGSAGIGKAVADALGESAIVWSRTSGAQVDAADPGQVEEATRQLLAEHGVPWGLVHTIGDFVEEPLLAGSRETFDAMVASNLGTLLEVVRAVVPAMVEAGRGRVVLFAAAGAGARRAIRRAPVYFAIKAAVVHMARSLAAEVAEAGVTVNVVSPGLIEHPGSHRESQQRMQHRVPLGRLGTVADVSGLVCWLLGEESAYVTGEEFTVDGGLQL